MLAVTAGAGAGAAVDELFLRPREPTIEAVNAVIVLGGDHGDRLDRALRLHEEGDMPIVVLSPDDGTQRGQSLCRSASDDVTCIASGNTHAEARTIGGLARERHWTRIAVVTSAFHVQRAGTLIRRCTDADVVMVPSTPPFTVGMWAKSVVREMGGLAAAHVLDRSC